MAKSKENKEVNLLPQEEFEQSTFGRSLKWILGTFRYIVISTEMIVMIAFFSRFYLDSRSADLINAINQRKTVIASYSGFENEFRNIQNKLEVFSNYSSTTQKLTPALSTISSGITGDITVTNIFIDGPSITIKATTPNENSMTNFVNNLNSSQLITGAKITSIETDEQTSQLIFTIAAKMKGRL